MSYTTRVNSTSEIAQDIENFNGTVTSIDKFSISQQGQNVVALIEYTS